MGGVAEDGKDVYLTFLPLYGAGCVFLGILLISLICKIFNKFDEYHDEFTYWFYRITALICFSSCFVCSIGDTIHLYLCWLNNYYMLGNQLKNIKAISDFFFFIASLSLNILLFGRVYFTFKHSFFALSKYTIFLISIIIISSIFCDLSYCVLVIMYGSNETKADTFVAPLVIAIVINDLIVSISMLYLFSYKLKEIIIMSNTLNADSMTKKEKYRKFKEVSSLNYDSMRVEPNSVLSSGKLTINEVTVSSSLITHRNSDTIKLDDIQLETLVVVTRHTILSGFAIFFNQLYYAFNYVSMRDKWENSYYYGLLVYGLRMIGMIGIVIALYLSMKFAKKTYFKCCACCHLQCYKCCIKCTKHTISNKRRTMSTTKKNRSKT